MRWKNVNVLFIGDEPSSMNVSINVAFVGTYSYKRLMSWIAYLDLDIESVRIINWDCIKFENGRYDKYVILGKSAEKKLAKKYGINFEDEQYATVVDHPSPRNRNFNDPEYEKTMLKNLKGWIYA